MDKVVPPPPEPPTRKAASAVRYLITGGVVCGAIFLAWNLWGQYLRSPWTRDGRVRVEVVNIASEVSGKVIELDIVDNQAVKKGDVLLVIDPVDYKLALIQAETSVRSRLLDRDNAREDAERREKLGHAVSIEEKNSFRNKFLIAEASYEAAIATRDQARVNLERTTIRSPVNGYVSNLTLRVGDYATPGQAKMTLVDSDTFWIVGYFEETKLPHVQEGDFAHVRLMGWEPEITGHVESISSAIADANNRSNGTGLADVDPIFTWVRLAQRLPVRIKIDEIPKGIRLAAGQTCTIVLARPSK